jgi:hypothetical protein
MGYDFSKKYMDKSAMDKYQATDTNAAKRYGTFVRAIPVSNREYQHRYDKLSDSRAMKPPPSSGRIFAGYLVIRSLDSKDEYETWIPDHAFEAIYERME